MTILYLILEEAVNGINNYLIFFLLINRKRDIFNLRFGARVQHVNHALMRHLVRRLSGTTVVRS